MLAAMRVQISQPALIEDLLAFLRQKGYDAERESEAGDLVSLRSDRDSPSAKAARMELELYLRVWEALCPDAAAALVD